jgi:glycosyltransferase involved in cell wall biosynthesis
MCSKPECILLISNYVPDCQHSMLRFADMLETGICNSGIYCKRLAPKPIFCRLRKYIPVLGKFLGYIDKYICFIPVLVYIVWKLSRKFRLCIHICDHSNAVYIPFIYRYKHLIMCHDLIAIQSALKVFPEVSTGRLGTYLQRRIISGLRQAKQIVCISHATACKLATVLNIKGPHVHVIHMGQFFGEFQHSGSQISRFHGSLINSLSTQPILLEELIGKPYILHVGNNAWYKNRLGVVYIFNQIVHLGHKASLVFVGEKLNSELCLLIQQLDLEAHSVCLVDIPDDLLSVLYRHAQLLLFPSIEEGFGWPIIEAQACSCLVAATDQPGVIYVLR